MSKHLCALVHAPLLQPDSCGASVMVVELQVSLKEVQGLRAQLVLQMGVVMTLVLVSFVSLKFCGSKSPHWD